MEYFPAFSLPDCHLKVTVQLDIGWHLLGRMLDHQNHGYTESKALFFMCCGAFDWSVLVHFLLFVLLPHYLSMEVITVHLLSLLPASDHD